MIQFIQFCNNKNSAVGFYSVYLLAQILKEGNSYRYLMQLIGDFSTRFGVSDY
jgi:hypothetical protein